MQKVFENFVQQTLNEAAKTVQDANADKLALCFHKGDRAGKVLLYDPVAMGARFTYQASWDKPDTRTDEQIQNDVRMWDRMWELPPIFGFALLVDPSNPAWGAAELSIAAAQPGWGPLLHDIVMTIFGTIIVDRRESVSEEERKLIRFYYEKREDVEKLKLDDIDHPKTKTPKDDSILQSPKTKDNFLNYAYRLQAKVSISQLCANHRKFLKDMKAYTNPQMYWTKNPGDVEEALFRKGFSYFSERYESVPYNKRELRKGWLKKT